MNLSDLITRVGDDTNTNISILTVSNRITREINGVCADIWNGFRWSFRWRNYRIITDTDVSTGSVTATNGSRVLTFAGVSLSAANVGWHINFLQDGVSNWYKINHYTSASQVEMDVPYTGTTGSGKTYVLRHFDYVLPTEPWDFGACTITHDKRVVPILEPYSMDILGPVPFYKGYPLAVSIFGSDSKPTTYTTGTVTGSLGGRTLTGAGTSWLSNIYPGDTVTIGSYNYQVLNVDTDTSITLYQAQQVASSGVVYTITRQFGRIMRVMWPSTDQYALDIRALRLYQPLVNNNDTNELLYRFPDMVRKNVSAVELNRQPDKRGSQMMQMAEISLQKAKAEDDALTVRDSNNQIFSYHFDRRFMYRQGIR